MAIKVEVLCHIDLYYGNDFNHFPVISVVNVSRVDVAMAWNDWLPNKRQIPSRSSDIGAHVCLFGLFSFCEGFFPVIRRIFMSCYCNCIAVSGVSCDDNSIIKRKAEITDSQDQE